MTANRLSALCKPVAELKIVLVMSSGLGRLYPKSLQYFKAFPSVFFEYIIKYLPT
jgi:hypothetical protein